MSVVAVCARLDAALGARRDFAALLVETRGALEASPMGRRLREDLAAAGLASEEAQSAATMLLAGIVVGRLPDGAAGMAGRSSWAVPRCSSTRPRSG